MNKDLTLPVDLPEDFIYTDPEGLTSEAAEGKLQAGESNRLTDAGEKTMGQILRSNLLTLFNLLNFSLVICLFLVGS